jgi:murein DD-endopeptidase MepM/ murein hydrolase activator NlpD
MDLDLDSKRRRRTAQKTRRTAFIGIVGTACFVLFGGIGLGVHALITGGHTSLVKDEVIAAQDAQEVAQPEDSEPTVIDATPDAEVKPLITTYTVVSGDTISEIAEKFHISVNTIRWANDLSAKNTIKVGQELVILPFTGIEYTVKKGDTLSGIVAKYNGDMKEIMDVNGLEDEKAIKPGDKILIPDGEMPAAVTKTATKTATKPSNSNTSTVTEKTTTSATKTPSGYFINPIPGAILTQGLHAVNAVDFGSPVGTKVRAAADGKVIIAKQGGYNGGFGSYIVINHPNGLQTLYGHLSKVEVAVGESVTQGQEIAKSGNTGKSTGPHLHFEVHGSTNPWTKYKVGTHF